MTILDTITTFQPPPRLGGQHSKHQSKVLRFYEVTVLFSLVTLMTSTRIAFAAEPAGDASDIVRNRCEVIPVPEHQASFQVDGIECVRWHQGIHYPRPFFFPLLGPSGQPLTRMGHPGAENHDHHQSVWFANHDVDGQSYWANGKGTRIRQQHWYVYQNGPSVGLMAVKLRWIDAEGNEAIQQDLVAAVIPHPNGQYELELQSDFHVGEGRDVVQLGSNNFGFLAVRVARSLSVHFGGGQIRNSEQAIGEEQIFGKEARWVDYSGPVATGTGLDRAFTQEGITFFDHPENPRYPSHWHVRADGWMGASFAMKEPYQINRGQPLRLRYSLFVHRGPYNHQQSESIAQLFSNRPVFVIEKSKQPHQQYQVRRAR